MSNWTAHQKNPLSYRHHRLHKILAFPSLSYRLMLLSIWMLLSGWYFLSGCSTPTISTSTSQPPSSAPHAAPLPLPQQVLTFKSEARNSDEAMKKPYVILVSIDGYRWDFTQRYSPPNIQKLTQMGASAQSLIPVFPSLTFPSHYAMATGLYPEHNGIVSNEFLDPTYSTSTSTVSSDPPRFSIPDKHIQKAFPWYEGEPIWQTLSRYNILTSSIFWVGSDVAIHGQYPNYYLNYDMNLSHKDRVNILLSLLSLPETKRPHFLTLYFSDVDSAGHESGPESEDTRAAVLNIDQAIGELQQGLDKTGLPYILILVSDHGMQQITESDFIYLDKFKEFNQYLSYFDSNTSKSNLLYLYLKDKKLDKISLQQKRILTFARFALQAIGRKNHFRILSKKEIQQHHLAHANGRTGDLILSSESPFMIGLHSPTSKQIAKSKANPLHGMHGWDARLYKNMHGFFVLHNASPYKVSAKTLASFENIQIYPLIIDILGEKIDHTIDAPPGLWKKILTE